MAECCTRDPNNWESSAALFGSWAGWATKAGETIGTQRAFGQKLEDRGGLAPSRSRDGQGVQGRGFTGIRINRYSGEYPRDE
jgi:hypothetical protein